MKRIFFALTLMAGCLLPIAPPAQAATAVSLNFFYDNLSPYGSWIEVADYGYCFQPNVAVTNRDWRPYSDGYWAYTDVGWTWVSYEDFGWATFHYGNWANLDDYGWVWVPGYEWGPAWVSWRTGGDYVGWAPLPPRRGVVYEGRAITGAVDVTFDIGPLYYNFVDIRFIGEPVLRGHIVEPRRNVTIINRTVNITNITYNNKIVINRGPDVERLNRYSTRPIQRLKLQRETTVNVAGRRGNLNRVNGNALVVAAPPIERSQQKIAPKQVKAKVAQPKIEHGWKGVENRPQLEAEMKKQNPKDVPPPTFQPQQAKKGQAAAEATPGAQPNEASPAVNANDREAAQSARRAAREERRENAAANPTANEGPAQPNEAKPRGERMRERGQKRAEQAKEKQAGQNEMKAEPEKENNQPGATPDMDRPEEQATPGAGKKARRAQGDEAGSDADRSEESRGNRRDKEANRPRSENPSPAAQGGEASQNEQSPPPQRVRSRRAAREQQLRQSQPGGSPEANRNRAARRAQQQQARPAQNQGQEEQGEQSPSASPKKKKRGHDQPEQPNE